MKYVLTLIMITCAFQLSAQKKLLLEDQSEIIERAKANIAAAFEDVDTELYETHMSYPYVGRYVFKITIGNKFRVTSIYAEEREGGSIPEQNRLKDAVMDLTFDFKMPKNKQYQFLHEFNFNQ